MKRVSIIATLIMALTVLGGTAALAAPFQNGSFESFTGLPGGSIKGVPGGSTAIDHWVVLGTADNNVELIYKGFWQAHDGNWSLDLNGTSVGGIETTFDTVTGVTYKVEFAMSGNFPSSGTSREMRVTATGNTPQTFTYYKDYQPGWSYSNMNWQEMLYTFTAGSNSTTLKFESLETYWTAEGPTLDAVSVSMVPLPPSFLLLGSGLLGLAVTRRGRRRG